MQTPSWRSRKGCLRYQPGPCRAGLMISWPATQLLGQTPEILFAEIGLPKSGAGQMEAHGGRPIPIGPKTGRPYLRLLHTEMVLLMPNLARSDNTRPRNTDRRPGTTRSRTARIAKSSTRGEPMLISIGRPCTSLTRLETSLSSGAHGHGLPNRSHRYRECYRPSIDILSITLTWERRPKDSRRCLMLQLFGNERRTDNSIGHTQRCHVDLGGCPHMEVMCCQTLLGTPTSTLYPRPMTA